MSFEIAILIEMFDDLLCQIDDLSLNSSPAQQEKIQIKACNGEDLNQNENYVASTNNHLENKKQGKNLQHADLKDVLQILWYVWSKLIIEDAFWPFKVILNFIEHF